MSDREAEVNNSLLLPPTPFLTKTFALVSDPETDAIVEWMPDGRSFLVKQTDELAKSLLPRYFKHSNYSSFVRQLNTYGFKKIDPDQWLFSNEFFVRGREDLLGNIVTRKRHAAATKPVAAANPAIEVGAFGNLSDEVEALKRDKQSLTKEVVRMRHKQTALENTMNHMQDVVTQTNRMNKSILQFLNKAIHNPSFLQQILQVQASRASHGNHGNEYLTHRDSLKYGRSKKRRATRNGTESPQSMDDLVDNNNAVVQYQPSGIDHHLEGMLREGASSNPAAAWGNEAPPGSAFGDVNSAFRGMNLDQAQQPYDMLAMPQIPHLSHLPYGEGDLHQAGSGAHHFTELIGSDPPTPSEQEAVLDMGPDGFGVDQNWADDPQNAELLSQMVMGESDVQPSAEDENQHWLQFLNATAAFSPPTPSPDEQAST